MLETILPEDVWKEAQPVLSVQGEVDWDPAVHDRFIRALHTVSLDQGSTSALGTGPLGGTMTATSLNGITNVPFSFLSLKKDVVFPPKKPTHPLKAADGRPLEGYTIKGLVKANWIRKHVTQLPSAAILLAPFDPTWPSVEWTQREQALLHDMERLRQQVGPRDVRIFVVLVRRPVAAPLTAEEQRESDERLLNFRRRAPPVFEAIKMVYVLHDPQDLVATAVAMRRLYKHVRDLSSGYYYLHCKRVNRWETALNRHAQLPLIIRYRLKQAFWHEFMGHAEKALRHFRRTFEALVEMQAGLTGSSHPTGGAGARGGPSSLGLSTSGGMGGGGGYTSVTPSAASSGSAFQLSNAHYLGGWVSQIRAVAEVVSFKICYYTMREALHGQALAQQRLLMQTWGWAQKPIRGQRLRSTSLDGSNRGVVVGGTADAPEHGRLSFLQYEWASRQCQIFGDLLQRFPSPPLSTPTSTELETYVDPDHYFFNAALYTAKERQVALFLQANPRTDSKFAARLASNLGMGEGPLLDSPLYLGGRPRLVDPSLEDGMLEADLNELIQLILEREEATRKPLSETVRRLLGAAVAVYDPSRLTRPRFKALQRLQLADELMGANLPGEAWLHYCLALRWYGDERDGGGWGFVTSTVLLHARQCALALGKQEQYLDLTLKLLSHGLRAALAPEDRRVFFLELWYLLFGLKAPDALLPPASASSSSPTLFNPATKMAPSSSTEGGPVTYDEGVDASFSSSSSLALALEPMVTLLPDAVEVALECGWRHLVSFSVTFPEASTAMGGCCPLVLRLVSHLPLPVRLSHLQLRFNKDIGIIRVVERTPSPSSPTDRLRQSFAPPPPPPPFSRPTPALPHPYTEVDETKVARVDTPLLLQPDAPLDLFLAVPVPTHELVEVGDTLHAVQLQLFVDAPPTPPSPSPSLSPWCRTLCLNVPSGVAYRDGFGVMATNIFKAGSPATHPSSLPVPLEAAVRGFSAVQIIRPVARASLGLSHEKEEEERLVTTLVEHMHCLWVKVESHEDALTNPMLTVGSDPPPGSGRPEDALFFAFPDAMEKEAVPLALGKDLQPEAAIAVIQPTPHQKTPPPTVLAPHSSVLVPVWVRPVQEGRTKINFKLVYHGAATSPLPSPKGGGGGGRKPVDEAEENLMVSSEYVFDLESYSPFLLSFDVASPCPAVNNGVSSKVPAALQDDPSGAESGAYTFFTGEQVIMRLSIKALQPSAWGEGPGGGRPRIEKVVWYPMEQGSWAVGRGASDNREDGGRVLYALGQDGDGEQDERGMQPQDVLSLTFPFLCPEKESTHALPLGRIRLFWRVVPGAAELPVTTWVSCTEAECPSVSVASPDVTVHLDAPLEATLGEAFKLRWTLRNLAGRLLTLRVLVKEGAGGSAGPSTEEALVWSGSRESVVQILPDEAVHLTYRVVPLLTGPIAFPRLVLTPLADSSSKESKEGGVSEPSPSLRVAYRYVDNVLSNSTMAPSTPSSAENRSAGPNQPADTRHLFVFPLPVHQQQQ